MTPSEWFEIEGPREGWLALPPVVQEAALRAWGASQKGKVKVDRNRDIMQAWAEGADCAELATRYGVTRTAIVDVRDRSVRRARVLMRLMACRKKGEDMS